MTVEAAKGRLDDPIAGRSPDGPEFWRQGEQLGLSFYHKNGVVWQVTDSNGPTPRGLNIGDSGKRVEQLYGQPTELQKHGWWRYSGDDGFSLTVVVRDDQVRQVFIENQSLVEVHPTPGRDLPSVRDADPFGFRDYSLAGISACSSIIDLRTHPDLEETLGSAERGTNIGFVTGDGHMRVDPAAAGSNRVDSIEVVGGPYETQRGVRVGDPIERARVLYGKSYVSDENVSLTFSFNVNGAITSIVLRCIREGGTVPSEQPTAPPSYSRLEGILVGVDEEVVVKRGYLTHARTGSQMEPKSSGMIRQSPSPISPWGRECG